MSNLAKKIEILTPKAVSERLGVSQSTLAKWRLDGSGPAFIKIGAHVAYDASMIEDWLASRVRRSTSDPGAGSAVTEAA